MDNMVPVDVLLDHIRKNLDASGNPTKEAVDAMGVEMVVAIGTSVRTFSGLMCGVIALHTGRKLEDLMASVGLGTSPEEVTAVRQFVGTETHH